MFKICAKKTLNQKTGLQGCHVTARALWSNINEPKITTVESATQVGCKIVPKNSLRAADTKTNWTKVTCRY